ncbi:Variable major outer membrane lipoprotein (plasmid) [Borrelia coriaceae ATCC 43381]|uniref:Variable large protein n=2 Tax=Borrelia coriaceae TaxID=144 RepID=W5SYJ5_9SPIR|nr:Variable major outer membrane lipoprotein [Borrelia coriaceae ATCC 43381]
MDVGRSAENVLYSFLSLISDTLGFTAKTTTKKENIGNYFSGLGEKLGKASAELEEVAKKAEGEGAREGEGSKNGTIALAIRSAVETAKTTLSELKKHLESLKDIGDANPVGNAASGTTQGTKPDDTELMKSYKAFKGIVKVAVDAGVMEPKVGDITVQIGSANNSSGAKILATDAGATSTDAAKAASILTTVSGEEMLASIVASGEGDAVLGAAADGSTTAMSFAKGANSAANLANVAAKAAAVSGGIALRSLVKSGTLASGASDGNTGGKEEVQKIGVTAVNKLLIAVEGLIKKTVKKVVEKAKGEIDKARAPKPAVSEASK